MYASSENWDLAFSSENTSSFGLAYAFRSSRDIVGITFPGRTVASVESHTANLTRCVS
jgi:hypothetical protein